MDPQPQPLEKGTEKEESWARHGRLVGICGVGKSILLPPPHMQCVQSQAEQQPMGVWNAELSGRLHPGDGD